MSMMQKPNLSQDEEVATLINDRQERNEQMKRVAIVFVPHLLVLFLYLSYIFIGAGCFRILDEELAKKPFLDVALFSFTTIATIGYGTLTPTSKAAKLFCVVYSLFGLPLCVAVLSNFSKYLSKAYFMACICVGKTKNVRIPHGDIGIPVKFIVLLYFVLFIFGSLLYPHNQKHPTFTLRNIYFSVVSFSTVGFGDEAPESSLTWLTFWSYFCYLTTGMVLSALLFKAVHSKLSHLNKFGAKSQKAQDVTVWFGDKPMKVSKLLEIVAKEFDAKPSEVHQLLHGLDALLEDAATINEQRKMSSQNNNNDDPCTSSHY